MTTGPRAHSDSTESERPLESQDVQVSLRGLLYDLLGRRAILGSSGADGALPLPPPIAPERFAISMVSRSAASGVMTPRMSDMRRGFILLAISTRMRRSGRAKI